MIKKIRLDDIERIDYIDFGKRVTVKDILKQYKPDLVLNGTLYDVATGTTVSNSVDENKSKGYLFSNEGIAFKNHLVPLFTTKKEVLANDTLFDFIGGSPTLVKDSKVYTDAGTTKSWILNGSYYRSFLGFNNDHLFLGASDYTSTIKSLATYCLNNGMKYAINLDGGGSCTLAEIKDGKINYLINRETRPNANWILVYYKKKVSTPTPTPTPTTTAKVVNAQKILANGNVPLEGINIEGRAYAPIRELEKLGFEVKYENGVVFVNTVSPK